MLLHQGSVLKAGYRRLAIVASLTVPEVGGIPAVQEVGATPPVPEVGAAPLVPEIWIAWLAPGRSIRGPEMAAGAWAMASKSGAEENSTMQEKENAASEQAFL